MTKLIRLNDARKTWINPDNITNIGDVEPLKYKGAEIGVLRINNVLLAYTGENYIDQMHIDINSIIKHIERIKK